MTSLISSTSTAPPRTELPVEPNATVSSGGASTTAIETTTPATIPPDAAAHTIITREEERRLESLRLQDANTLSEAEAEELRVLTVKYERFLAEGVRRLQDGVKCNAPPGRTDASPAPDEQGADSRPTQSSGLSWSEAVASSVSTAVPVVAQAAGTLGRAAYFWGSLVGTAVPALAKKAGLTECYDHWNFVTDRLILGALPVITQIGSSGNHLVRLNEQLQSRCQTLGLVVACLGEDEMSGFGLQLVEFAQKQHWHKFISPAIEYLYLPMVDGTAEVSMELVRQAVDRLHETLDVHKQCAYVHCKAGKGRSWMVVMCYLTTFGGRTFENAEALVNNARHQVNPSSAQRDFARDFCKKFHADEEAKKLMHECVEPE